MSSRDTHRRNLLTVSQKKNLRCTPTSPHSQCAYFHKTKNNYLANLLSRNENMIRMWKYDSARKTNERDVSACVWETLTSASIVAMFKRAFRLSTLSSRSQVACWAVLRPQRFKLMCLRLGLQWPEAMLSSSRNVDPKKQRSSAHVLRRVSCEQQLDIVSVFDQIMKMECFRHALVELVVLCPEASALRVRFFALRGCAHDGHHLILSCPPDDSSPPTMTQEMCLIWSKEIWVFQACARGTCFVFRDERFRERFFPAVARLCAWRAPFLQVPICE